MLSKFRKTDLALTANPVGYVVRLPSNETPTHPGMLVVSENHLVPVECESVNHEVVCNLVSSFFGGIRLQTEP